MTTSPEPGTPPLQFPGVVQRLSVVPFQAWSARTGRARMGRAASSTSCLNGITIVFINKYGLDYFGCRWLVSNTKDTRCGRSGWSPTHTCRSEEHTSELQSLRHLVC